MHVPGMTKGQGKNKSALQVALRLFQLDVPKNDGNASDYGPSAEDTPSDNETLAQKNLRLNWNRKAAARKKAAEDKQAKIDQD
ncbi:hypothetical protein C0992_010009 [Termitomyces sp. T32_za158]|nr:hypothetical protein C0992_010009 [Termitomyces sp. T32_za158]